jgi:hypothetical protein
MKNLRLLHLLAILVVALLVSCAKDDPVAPHDCQHQDDAQTNTKALMNGDGAGHQGVQGGVSKGDPSLMLRDGGVGDEGGEGGGGSPTTAMMRRTVSAIRRTSTDRHRSRQAFLNGGLFHWRTTGRTRAASDPPMAVPRSHGPRTR